MISYEGKCRDSVNYLKVIYSLCGPGEAASTSSIADALDVQPASVTGMVKRLAEAGFKVTVLERGTWRDTVPVRSMGIEKRSPLPRGRHLYGRLLRAVGGNRIPTRPPREDRR